jgi:hypothetical protein
MTELCGVIKIPTSLILSKSPYKVTGDLYIPVNSRLTIEAGVEVLIDQGDKCNEVEQIDWNDSQMVSIKVDGAFFIEGRAGKPVIIKPLNNSAQQVLWDGIRMRDRNRLTTQIQHLHISGAHRAIYAKRSKFSISNSLFSHNSTGIYLDLNANLNISNSIFSQNLNAGIFQNKAAPNLVSNIFYENYNYGIWSDSRTAIRIQHNVFWENKEEDCYHCPAKVGFLSQVNHREDSTDFKNNLFLDPLFVGSKGADELRKKDLSIATPDSLIVDTTLARKEQLARKKTNNLGMKKESIFNPRGQGKFRLSKYSSLTHTGPEEEFFKNEDGSRNDIGLHGGKHNLVKLRFIYD